MYDLDALHATRLPTRERENLMCGPSVPAEPGTKE